jgi:hypothetical protein
MNGSVSIPFVFRGRMVDPGRVVLDKEIVVNQGRFNEAVNVIIGVEDEPNASEIAAIKLQSLGVQFVLLD